MTIATLTGSDVRTRDAVMRELEADPRFDASGIGVVEILNHIQVVPVPSPRDLRHRITEALHGTRI